MREDEKVTDSIIHGNACLTDRNAKSPVVLSYGLVPAEQELPLVRPAGSSRAPSLCVHSSLPVTKKTIKGMRATSDNMAINQPLGFPRLIYSDESAF